MAPLYSIGSLVWAKMKGFAPWPGRVVIAPDSCKKPSKSKNVQQQCIFFYGSKNYAWIEETQIKPYNLFKDQFSKTSNGGLKDAIREIEEYIIANGADIPKENNVEAEFEKLKSSGNGDLNSTTESTPKSKKERKRKDKDTSGHQTPKKRRATQSPLMLESTSYRSPSPDYSPLLNSTSTSTSTLTRRPQSGALLNRPSAGTAQMVDLDVGSISENLLRKNISPSLLKFGFLGLGIMGSGIVKNLLNSGHAVYVWNRTPTKCEKFAQVGAEVAQTPSDVIDACDITYSCVADPSAANEMVFGNCGVMSAMRSGKGYVEMTGIDAVTSAGISETITQGGGRFLEAMIQGSRRQAEEGNLLILAAGDQSLFNDCQTCFAAMGKSAFFLGDVGNATRMNLILNMINGIALAGLAEGLALADRSKVMLKDIIEIFKVTQVASPFLVEKGTAILEGGFPTNMALSLMQKDLRLALQLGDSCEQPLPLCASANEVYKHAKRLGYSDHDISAVYIRARF